jgi:hypothetical protein
MAETTSQTYNTDIDGLVRRIDRIITEVIKSQSSGVSQTISFDVVRAKAYVESLRSYIDYVTSQPLMDLPETGPRAISMLPKVVIPRLENESSYDMATMFDLMRDEMAGSNSSRLPSGLISHDEVRARSYLVRIDNFINGYITVIDPLDLPESSPMTPVSGPGKQGV